LKSPSTESVTLNLSGRYNNSGTTHASKKITW
jgi:hypothetical protein